MRALPAVAHGWLARRAGRPTPFSVANAALLAGACVVVLYPLWFSIIYSFNDGVDIARRGPIYLWPRSFTLENYAVVLHDSAIVKAFGVSVARTAVGTTVHVLFTAMVAYAFSKRELMGRRVYLAMGTVTLFFSGGLIPTFLVIRNLGLIDRFLVYVLPTAFYFFDALVFMSFYKTVPEGIEESARMDGANDFLIFRRLVLPVCTAVVATIAIFNGVFNWNDYFMGVIYITRRTDLQPIQTFLYKMVATTEAYGRISAYAGGIATTRVTPQSVRIATMVLTTAPIVCVYPLLQRHFTKGILLGAVKG